MVILKARNQQVSASIILILLSCLAVSGCERLFGPLAVNETDASVQIEMIFIVTQTKIEESTSFKLEQGEISPWWPYYNPRELIGIVITYNEEKTIRLDRQYLSTAFSKIGGQKHALLLIRSDGVQIVNMIAYWGEKRRSG